MGRSIFSPSPSPSPSVSWSRAFYRRVTSDHDLFLIECGVLVTMVFVFWLFVLGCRRRYVHDTWQGGCILLLSTSINIGISYLIGIMLRYSKSPSGPSLELFPIWVNFLIFVYGSFDTMTAISFSDNQKSVWTFLSVLPLVMGTHNLTEPALIKLGHTVYEWFLILYVFSILNATHTVLAYGYASKSEMLPKITAPTVRFMRSKLNTGDKAEADLGSVSTPSGYSYLVKVNDAPEKIITTVQVWECEGPLLNPIAGNGDNKNSHKRSGRLKDICLSHALFNILLTRFAGYSLPESSRRDLRSFVKEQLSKGGQIQDGVLSIIEVELEFLFDLFYTKFYFLSRRRSPKLFRIMGVIVSVVFVVLEFGPYKLTRRVNAVPISSTQLHGYSLEVGVTRVVILVIGVLEVVQLCQRIFSNWTIVNLICRYVRDYEPNRTKKITRIERAAVCVSDVRYFISGIVKPWKRKLGQYSLLESYNHVSRRQHLRFLPHYVYKPRDGKKESPAVTLSVQVKRAVLAALSVSDYGLTLSRGKNSLVRNGVGWISDLFDQQNTSDAHFILVWHIATSVCEHSSNTGNEHFRVATELSKYCAYVLVLAPELVSAFPSTALAPFDRFIEQARDTFKRTRTMKMRCIKLLELGTNEIEDSDDVLGRAGMLANHLRSHVLNEPDRGWQVMAEFWAELLLYLAPTENVTAHGERLAKGGKFITHLWALLTHAGITSKASFKSASSGLKSRQDER